MATMALATMAFAMMTLAPAAYADSPNTLSRAERAAGWRLLFDGHSTAGWRGFKRTDFPAEGWVVVDGTLAHTAGKGEQSQAGGDIITQGVYSNFELTLDWKLAPGGNSGIKYLIDESLVKDGHSGLGFEMQILDDDRHPDAKKGKDGNRTAGALYDLIAPKVHAALPPGQWNHVRLVVRGTHVEHWLNGTKVVEYERGSPALTALIAQSKYKDIAGFGQPSTGHILLQDHGDEVAFRNIKLRELVVPGKP